MAFDDTLARLLEHWDCGDVRRRDGATPARIAEFEGTHGVALPADFRAYLLARDGMDDGDLDRNLFTFWSLDRIVPIHEHLAGPHSAGYRDFPGSESFFGFADWMIDADDFYIELHPDPSRANRFRGLRRGFLPYESFADFVEAYLMDPHDLI